MSEDHNATISPAQARRSGTRLMRAVDDAHAARRARHEGVSPTTLFWVGMVRNFILGVPFTGIGFVWAYRAHAALDKAGGPVRIGDLPTYIPAGVFLLVGMAFLAPTQTEAALRFIGLGNIIDRLPFLRPKTNGGGQ